MRLFSSVTVGLALGWAVTRAPFSGTPEELRMHVTLCSGLGAAPLHVVPCFLSGSSLATLIVISKQAVTGAATQPGRQRPSSCRRTKARTSEVCGGRHWRC